MSDEMPERVWLSPKRAEVYAKGPNHPNHDPVDTIEYVQVSKVAERLNKIMRLWNDDRITLACADMIAELTSVPEPVPQEVRSRADLAGGVVPQPLMATLEDLF